jgi:Flp pilus assembly protein TadB
MNNTNNTSGGIGFTGLLTIVFIILKLCGVISWSWLWVLSPLWISVIIAILIIVIYIAYLTHDERDTRKRGTGKWKF